MKRNRIPFLLLALLAGCEPSVQVVGLSGSRVVERPVLLGLPIDQRFGMRETAPQAEPAPPQPLFAWDVPDGWTELPASQFRLASFAIPGGGDCSISQSGGSLDLNVNRWRRQLGLEPLDSAGIAALPREDVGRLRSVVVVELEGEYTGMGDDRIEDAKLLGLITEVGASSSLFFKLVGPRGIVDGERERLFALAASLRATPQAAAAVSDDVFEPGALRWKVPAAWTESPSSSSFRLVTVAPAEHPEVECWVTVLGGNGGGLAGNINRWRNEVGEPALDEAALAALPRLRMLGVEAPMVEAYGNYRGQNGELQDGGLLGTVCLLGSHALFVKLVGPAELVRAEKERFVEFCESLET